MMKIVRAIVFLLLSVTSFGQTQAKILPVDIRGVGCHGGSGLCSVMSENKNVNDVTKFIVKESFNTIILIIDPYQLSIEEQTNCFGKEFSKIILSDNLLFAQDTTFKLDEKSLIYLGLESKYTTIKNGTYSSKIIKNKIHVKMPLLEN